MKKPIAKKVLLIGWDGADWRVINPLIDAGKMPAFERFINSGVMGKIATLHPPLSPMLWTSIATGMRPFKHGIHGFTEPDPHTGGIRPVTSTSRTVKAIWNILNQNGLKSNVIGWWPSQPAEPINGVMVSNHFQRTSAPIDHPWPMLPGTVHPENLADQIANLRIHPAEITAPQILPFIPQAADIDQEEDPRLSMLTRILSECSTVHACATAVVQLETWDFMAVYYDAIDHFSHGFMKYHPPRQKHISKQDFELYKDVVEGCYRFHDMMLGVLLKLAGEDTTVILVSDHGFHPDDLRPTRIPHEPAGPAIEHSPYGIFAMKGPGILKDELIYGASLLDIAPTALTLFGLPAGEDMDGKPLVQCFKTPPDVETIPSWENVEGNDGQHPAEQRMDPAESREAINQLIALGYIEDPGEDLDKAVEKTIHEAHYNLAQSFIDANRHNDAVPLLEELCEAEPDELRFANRLAHCYQVLGRLSEYRSTIESMIETQGRLAEDARLKLKEYARKLDASKGEETAIKNELNDKEKAEEHHRAQVERCEIQRLQALAAPRKYWADYLMGCLLFAEENHTAALDHLQIVEKAEPRLPHLHLQLGHIYLKLKKWQDAERSFAKALAIDPDNAQAHLGRCQSLLPRRKNLDAAEEALTAVGLLYYYPQAHFYLGVALHRVGYIDRAIEALHVAVSQNPNFIEAHKRLEYIYKIRLKNPQKARHHRNEIKEIRRRRKEQKTNSVMERPNEKAVSSVHQVPLKEKEATSNEIPQAIPQINTQRDIITIVSGLPRSGTSMMMQMLMAGGHPCLIDKVRKADVDNPHGYFEFEKVKQLRTDQSWLKEARGSAVKVIAQLIPFLPSRHNYRVIFMERAIEEILASQNAMLEHHNRKGAHLSDERLREAFINQVQQVKNQLVSRQIPTLYVEHQETIKNPDKISRRLKTFLGDGLDEEATADAVEPELYRQREESTN